MKNNKKIDAKQLIDKYRNTSMTLNNNSPNSFGDILSARTYDNNHLRDLKLLTDFDGGLRSQEDLTQNFNYEKTMSAASS